MPFMCMRKCLPISFCALSKDSSVAFIIFFYIFLTNQARVLKLGTYEYVSERSTECKDEFRAMTYNFWIT